MKYINPLSKWLKSVIDDGGVHTRERWCSVLGVSSQEMNDAINNNALLDPDILDHLTYVLRTNHAISCEEALKEWDRIVAMPLIEVSPNCNPKILSSCNRLADYIVKWLLSDLYLHLFLLPFEKQREIVSEAGYKANEENLKRLRKEDPDW